MVVIRVGNNFPYECEDEDKLKKILESYQVQPKKIEAKKYSLSPDAVYIVLNGLAWWINGKLLDKLMKEFPKLIKKKK